jgi:hypothetical protein
MADMVKRLVALSASEYKLAQRLSKGIGFSGYAAEGVREKMANDLARLERMKRAEEILKED